VGLSVCVLAGTWGFEVLMHDKATFSRAECPQLADDFAELLHVVSAGPWRWWLRFLDALEGE
jgi:hypothetical protein